MGRYCQLCILKLVLVLWRTKIKFTLYGSVAFMNNTTFDQRMNEFLAMKSSLNCIIVCKYNSSIFYRWKYNCNLYHLYFCDRLIKYAILFLIHFYEYMLNVLTSSISSWIFFAKFLVIIEKILLSSNKI